MMVSNGEYGLKRSKVGEGLAVAKADGEVRNDSWMVFLMVTDPGQLTMVNNDNG